jgi:hypothetical protein
MEGFGLTVKEGLAVRYRKELAKMSVRQRATKRSTGLCEFRLPMMPPVFRKLELFQTSRERGLSFGQEKDVTGHTEPDHNIGVEEKVDAHLRYSGKR